MKASKQLDVIISNEDGRYVIRINPAEGIDYANILVVRDKLPVLGEMNPFASDGCTLSPDFDFYLAGVQHDLEYWIGGTDAERLAADKAFRLNIKDGVIGRVREVGGGHWMWNVVAWCYWIAVRIGGQAWMKTPWRWGFGHKK